MPALECTLGGWWPLGCGIASAAKDSATSILGGFFAGILESIASWLWSFISGAFGVSNVDASQWTAVHGLTGWWVIVMMTPLVVVMILQLLSGLVAQQPRRIWRALIGGFLAVPAVGGAVYLMQALTHVSDSASTALLDTMGPDPYVVFMRLFGFRRGPAGSGQAWMATPFGEQASTGDPAVGTILITVMATLIVWVLAFILMCSMIFRSFALIVLAAVAPVALMLMPWEKTKSWAGRWCEIVVALLLAKPLAATILAVAVKLYAHATSFDGMAAGAVGMALACAAPLMALKLVGFAGGELAAAAQAAGGGHIAQQSSRFAGRQLGQQLRSHHLLTSSSAKSPKVVQSSSKPETAHVKKPADASPEPGAAPDTPKVQQRPGGATTPPPAAAAPKPGQASPTATPGPEKNPGRPQASPEPSTGSNTAPGTGRKTRTGPGPANPGPTSVPKPRPPATGPGNPPIRPPQTGEHHE
ncbi:type IV secretion system protein [Arthrobacter sp. A2-55]|uniref:type IV secretion system protein n=1 Tax=Arthrobacter sp. A2-55 TaxID=2897337 RepID=UPI0021CD8622|nr:type IV secretion system protein [Arthrobacter sp. A2-55]MCU6480454.1 type IV secretion system protein [Arthrobacter sp. A2-55]